MPVKITKAQKSLLESVALALATANKEGTPNVVAVSCVKVVGKNEILISDNFMNKTKLNLLANNKVAIAVWSKDEGKGYQLKGKADYLTDGKWKKVVDQMPKNQGLAHKAAVLVTVEEVWNLAEPKLVSKE